MLVWALLLVTHCAVSCTVVGNEATCTGTGTVSRDDVTSAGSFSNWVKLTIGEGITELGYQSFQGCTSLNSVSLPDSLVTMADYCFQSGGFPRITLPKKLVSISSLAFNSTPSLLWIDVDGVNPYFKSVDGCLYDHDMTAVVCVPCGMLAPTIVDGVLEMSAYCCRWGQATVLVIPNTVKTVASSCFYSSALIDLTIGSGVTSIATNAFVGCASLETVTVVSGNTFVSVKNGVLQSSKTIYHVAHTVTSITVPKSITAVTTTCLCNAKSLTTLYVESGGKSFSTSSDNTLLLNKAGKKVVSGLGGSTSVVIGGSINNVAKQAFFGCAKLRSVKITSVVTTLGVSVFRSLTALEEFDFGPSTVTLLPQHCLERSSLKGRLILPTSVVTLDMNALSHMNVSYISFPSVTTVGDMAVYYCDDLEEVYLPKVETIVEQAFYACPKLKKIDFGSNNVLKTLSSMSLASCTSLVTITIPSSIENLKAFVFSDDISLLDIEIAEPPAGSVYHYVSVDGVPYTKDLTTFVACPAGRSRVQLLNSTTTIGQQSFYGCRNLVEVVMNDQVAEIATTAFYDCSMIEMIRLPGSIKKIGLRAFDSCARLRSVLYCNNVDCPGFTYDSFPTNPDIYVFYDYSSPDGTFCAHECIKILDWACNIPTPSFTAIDQPDTTNDQLALIKLMVTALHLQTS